MSDAPVLVALALQLRTAHERGSGLVLHAPEVRALLVVIEHLASIYERAKRAERLAVYVRDYGDHLAGCGGADGRECACGFDRALEATS